LLAIEKKIQKIIVIITLMIVREPVPHFGRIGSSETLQMKSKLKYKKKIYKSND